MSDSFKDGDVVQLKSGGPLMTIKEPHDPGTFICEWFEGAKKQQSVFKGTSLEKVDDK